MSARGVFNRLNRQEEEYWISVSDMMAGLMVVFLFIAIIIRPFTDTAGSVEEEQQTGQPAQSTQQTIEEEEKALQTTANILREIDDKIYQALMNKFGSRLEEWDAEIIRETLVFRLKHPEVLFEKGRAELRPKFKEILIDFCPDYIRVLMPFGAAIDEVRIEGHTSTEWEDTESEDEAYFLNMELSQDRTRSVLQFCMRLNYSEHRKSWVRQHMTANGLSSSHLILEDDVEDKVKSRRVEFRVQTSKDIQNLDISNLRRNSITK